MLPNDPHRLSSDRQAEDKEDEGEGATLVKWLLTWRWEEGMNYYLENLKYTLSDPVPELPIQKLWDEAQASVFCKSCPNYFEPACRG